MEITPENRVECNGAWKLQASFMNLKKPTVVCGLDLCVGRVLTEELDIAMQGTIKRL